MLTVPKAALALVAALSLPFVALTNGQAPTTSSGADPAFEVASVKPNKSGDGGVRLGIQPGGRLTATNVPLRLLIRNAYQIQDFQLVGAPDWIAAERFDVVAKADGDVPPPQPGGPPSALQLMMRTLLAERFKLAVHHETRELPVYALVVARSDGKLGSQLQASTTDCAAIMAAARGRGGPPALSPPGRPPCGISLAPGRLGGGGFPLSQLATTLSQFVQRMVVDRTGLAGNFDFELTWTPDQFPQGPPPPDAPPLPPIDPNGPSIYTAVQEQLGLKLDSRRDAVDVLVVDRVERPTED
jgi:uncharacterized protein (TIGR03435 family)